MGRRVIAARAIIREAIRLVGLDTTAELLLAEATVIGRLKHHA